MKFEKMKEGQVAIPSYVRSIQSQSSRCWSSTRSPRRNPFVCQVDSVSSSYHSNNLDGIEVAIPSYVRSIQSKPEPGGLFSGLPVVAIPSYVRSIQSLRLWRHMCGVSGCLSQSLRMSGRFSHSSQPVFAEPEEGSQSLRMSGRFSHVKIVKEMCILNSTSQSLRMSGRFSRGFVNPEMRPNAPTSQSLRMSGRFSP